MLRTTGWLTVAALCWWATPALPEIDDPYITLTSAQALLRGEPDPYGGPALVGITSPPYAAALVALLALGLPALEALRLLAAAGAFAAVAATWALGRAVGVPKVAAALLVGFLLTAWATWAQLTNGLETGFAVALVTAMLAWALAGRDVPVALGAGLLPWLRPDLAPVGAAVLGFTVVRTGRRSTALLALATALPWALWVKVDTGAWLPQTMSAKHAFFAEAELPLPRRLELAQGALGVWLVGMLPLAVGLFRLPFHTLGRLGLAAAAVTIGAYVAVLPGGLAHNDHRYLYPILLPWMLLGAADLVKGWTRQVQAGVAVAAALALGAFVLREDFGERAATARERRDTARWIAEHTEPDAVVLVHDAGAAALWGERRVVDLVGLKTPASIDAHRSATLPSSGAARSAAVASIARSAAADYVVVNHAWEEAFGLARGLREAGVPLVEVRSSPLPEGYAIYRVERRPTASAAPE